MWTNIVVFLVYINLQYGQSADDVTVTECKPSNSTFILEDRSLCEYVVELLNHYKDPDPVGLPGLEIPDPYLVPDMRKYLGIIGSITFKNTSLYGLRKFRIINVDVDVENMQGRVALEIDKLVGNGNYSLSTWLKSYSGHYTADVEGIKVTASVSLAVDGVGRLTPKDLKIDLKFKHIAIQFENSSILALVLEGLFNSLGNFLFDAIKPYILQNLYVKVNEEFSSALDKVADFIKFPNSISPVDSVFMYLRKQIIEMQMDPVLIDDYYNSVNIFDVELIKTYVTGLSTIHRVGNTTLKIENNIIIVDIDISTQELKGSTNFQISTFRQKISRFGSVAFTIDYIRIRMVLAQSLDTRKKADFKDIDVEIGNIQIRVEGVGIVDYAVEFVVNILPNLLRNQVIHALENPLRLKVQANLNEIDVENYIVTNLQNLLDVQRNTLNLSEVSSHNVNYNEDVFFNF